MRAVFLLPQSQSSFPQAGCPCSGMRGCLSPPAADSFSRHPSLLVKLGRPMTWGHWGRNWAFKCQVPAHVMAGKGCLAVSTDHWPCAAHKAQGGGPSNLLPWIPAWDFPHLLCLALVALILPCVSSSPSGSHVLQGDLIMSWWCHLVNAIRKFPQDFSCFAGSRAWLPGHPCCSSAHSFSQKPSTDHASAQREGLAASLECPAVALLPSRSEALGSDFIENH